jgi:hypothetical protein
MGKMTGAYRVLAGKLDSTGHLEETDTIRRIILKYITNN